MKGHANKIAITNNKLVGVFSEDRPTLNYKMNNVMRFAT